MADHLPTTYDAIIIGTDLTQSILAAALSKAGYKILHLDHQGYYGAEDASLTIDEIVSWAHQYQSLPSSSRFTSVSYSFPAFPEHTSLETLPEALKKSSRQYTLSLSPSLIPSTGPLITALIKSGVARHSAFRLLEAIALYSSSSSESEPGRAGERFARVPATKQDVFTDKQMSLPDKRRLMKFLMFAARGNFAATSEVQGSEETPLPVFLREKFALAESISNAITFALAHCASSNEPTLPALERMHRYLLSAGRYGNSPFLIGHYGGAGELAQGFCRVCAVRGGTYILGHKIEHLQLPPPEEGGGGATRKKTFFSVKLEEIGEERLEAPVLVTSYDRLPGLLGKMRPEERRSSIARCIAIVDSPISFSPPAPFPSPSPDESEATTIPAVIQADHELDTYLLVFPPRSLGNETQESAVTALVTGQGTMSSPADKYIVYLTAAVSEEEEISSAETILRPYLSKLLSFSHAHRRPLFELFYTQRTSPSAFLSEDIPETLVLVDTDPASPSTLTETGDKAAVEAERAFRVAVRLLEKVRREGEDDDDDDIEFWPALEAHEKDERDEEEGGW